MVRVVLAGWATMEARAHAPQRQKKVWRWLPILLIDTRHGRQQLTVQCSIAGPAWRAGHWHPCSSRPASPCAAHWRRATTCPPRSFRAALAWPGGQACLISRANCPSVPFPPLPGPPHADYKNSTSVRYIWTTSRIRVCPCRRVARPQHGKTKLSTINCSQARSRGR
ncbi:uncharacterized protein B0I36DRAFT_408955 [Microdochium trichocladiopsis]|uniref:Uncharacterized protein n=1 Tax=Microdochium trichocladiopsis TaxID=1682393 RepID=A0A9P9BQD6_9PEZI|nr:uncharacterized protein B0I36DRAFT_408955 [Microdochium trichocladiopsis]KAH7030755.1 hypothetical protein B0I36DRAFT_408955 [Microdochium trichocladiopsis]